MQNVIDILKPVLEHGLSIEVSYSDGHILVDLNTQAKSGCCLTIMGVKSLQKPGIPRKLKLMTWMTLPESCIRADVVGITSLMLGSNIFIRRVGAARSKKTA